MVRCKYATSKQLNIIVKNIRKKRDIMKKNALLIFSIAFLAIGGLGLIGIGFFKANLILMIIEIVLGAVGLLLVFGKIK